MSNNERHLARVAGLDISLIPTFWAGTGLLILLISGGLLLLTDASLLAALGGGLLGTALYWLAEILHHFGHAIAAQRTGHPMIGVRLGVFLILGTSLYPQNEGDLPAALHIRRASGGPITSAILGLIFIAAGALLIQAAGEAGSDLGAWVLGFGLLNLLYFSLGALIPIMGMTDGSTILYWRKRL